MDPEKILLIQLRRVGDVVFTLPAIGVLRRKFPRARIDFLVEAPADQFVRLNPFLNDTLVYDKRRPLFWMAEVRRRRYDWVLDFHANGRTLWLSFFSGAPVRAGFQGPWNRRLAYNRTASAAAGKYIVEQKLDLLKSLGVSAGSWSWDLEIPPGPLEAAETFLKQSGLRRDGRKIAGIAPASRRETRAWLPSYFADVARRLAAAGHAVLLLIGPGEKKLADAILAQAGLENSPGSAICMDPEASLTDLAALIRKCSLVVASDNGPKNIAVALGVPTVTVYGPTDPKAVDPHGDPRHRTVRDDSLFCIGCGLNRCPYRHECMVRVTPERVWKEIEQILKDA